MSESLMKNIEGLKSIYYKSYWWAERYDYIESLPIEEVKELESYLRSRKSPMHESFIQNMEFCQTIIARHRESKLKNILS